MDQKISKPPAPGLILMGLKHSGKTTLGKLLAGGNRLFLDLDDLILKVYRELPGDEGFPPPSGSPTVRDIYRRSGELFRRCETLAAREAAEIMEGRPAVLALGGGTIENSQAMLALEKNPGSGEVLFIYLETDEASLFKRIKAEGIPPFLNSQNPEKSFSALYRRRAALCGKKADLTINLSGLSLEQSFKALLQSLGEF
ncbi:MAG: hypothetical protein LBQ61_06790 [Spirochaetales bacterium]|nr:hypothetical protein [Spirochaetales bacterium]